MWVDHVTLERILPGVWKAASGGVPRVKNMQGNKSVIVIRMVVALLILYAVFGLIRKTLPALAVGNGTGTHQASS